MMADDNIKLRRVERTFEEQIEFDNLIFVLPRKSCYQIIPTLVPIKNAIRAKKQAEKEHDEREDNDFVDNEADENSGLLDLISNEANTKSVEKHKAIVAQHRLHIYRRLMQKARTKNIDSNIHLFTEIDESDHIVPDGEASKKVYEDLFHSRNFNLYGELKSSRILHPPRRYLELRALAAELGIYFTQSVDKKHADYLLYEEAQSKKEVLDADMQEHLEASKIPKIVTEKWKIRMTKKYNAPVGFARNPGEIPESRGNEEFYSYDGDWRGGFMEGNGVYLFDDECKYEGEFKAGKPHGQGTTVYPAGQTYTGSWKEGRLHGMGKFVSCSGSLYEGFFEFGRRSGSSGKLSLPSGLTYDGEFLDGKPHGRGVMKSVRSGWSYEGNFERGSICGSGVLITPPPENNRIVQYWPESKNDVILPTAVRRYLKEIADFKAFREKQNKDVYGPLRGAQLKTYINTVRNNLYSEQQTEKKRRYLETVQKQKEQKEKLYEARMRALAGDDDA